MIQIKKIIPICAIAAGMALVGVTSGFTKAPKTSSDPTSYFFEYRPGEIVHNPSSWEYTTDNLDCEGTAKSCTIEIKAAYVDAISSPNNIVIDSLSLPNGLLPTTTSSASIEVPDGNSNVYVQVFNQDL